MMSVNCICLCLDSKSLQEERSGIFMYIGSRVTTAPLLLFNIRYVTVSDNHVRSAPLSEPAEIKSPVEKCHVPTTSCSY